jgi:hypothetical protein
MAWINNIVLDGDERVGWFENRFPEMMGDER